MFDDLVCPVSQNPLQLMSRETFDEVIGRPSIRLRTSDLDLGDSRFQMAAELLADVDSGWAYPVVNEIPILLSPERLGDPSQTFEVDLRGGMFQEAYAEMEFYNLAAEKEVASISASASYASISSIVESPGLPGAAFPSLEGGWLDAVFDCVPQHEAYMYISPDDGDRFLQVGGKGSHAVKFLLAGCAEATVISPMLGEALLSKALAAEFGLSDTLRPVVAMAEELPFESNSFDLCYSGGSLHHTDTSMAIPEIARVLEAGGRFSSVDMWDAPLYSRLISIAGKRESGIECKPLNEKRMKPLQEEFQYTSVQQHGSFSRYPVFAFQRAGVDLKIGRVWKITTLDNLIASKIPGARSLGSAVVSTATLADEEN